MAAGIQPFAVGGADQWPATRIINAYVMRKLGVDAMNKMAAGELSYTDPGMVEAAKMLQDMCQKGYFGVGPTTVDQNTAAQMILAGEAAILYNGSWYTQDLVADTNPAGEDGIGFFNIPTVEGGPGTLTEYSMNCGTILCLSKDKYDAETADWLKYIVTNLGDYAVALVPDAGMSFEMEKYMKRVNPEMAFPVGRILELNPEHPAVQAMEVAMATASEKAKDYAQLLCYQAQLMAELPLEDPFAYTQLVCKLMQ
jgi:hypothetical protein